MFIYTTELSVNLLINVIATLNFQHDQCIAYYSPNENPYPYRISPLSQSFPVVLNDYECKHGCRQYIVENPQTYLLTEFNPFRTCMVRQRNADMKAILMLGDSLNMYRNLPGDFGINVVIIVAIKYYYYVYGHTDLAREELVVLNRWHTMTRQFVSDPGSVRTDTFFDNRWKNHPNTKIYFEIEVYYPHMFPTASNGIYGVDVNIIYHYTRYVKVLYGLDFINETFIQAAFEKGAFLLARRTSNQIYFPQTYPTTIISYAFAVPKPG